MWVPPPLRHIPTASEIVQALLSAREERKARRNQPEIEHLYKNVFEEGEWCQHLQSEPASFACVEETAPPVYAGTFSWTHRVHYFVVLRYLRQWERKNGRRTGKHRDEFLGVVSREKQACPKEKPKD